MREIRDTERLEQLYKKVEHHFQSRPVRLHLEQFEKGEFLTRSFRPLEQLLIVVQGSVSIYDLSDDGSIHYVTKVGAEMLLGDVEFCGVENNLFYAEAAERVVCLAIPLAENRDALENDPHFLRFALQQLAKKLSLSSMDIARQTLKEKVLLYLEKEAPDQTIHSVNEAVIFLHCSRRQIQRVLKKLCEEGKLQKLGRGCYRLAENQKKA